MRRKPAQKEDGRKEPVRKLERGRLTIVSDLIQYYKNKHKASSLAKGRRCVGATGLAAGMRDRFDCGSLEKANGRFLHGDRRMLPRIPSAKKSEFADVLPNLQPLLRVHRAEKGSHINVFLG
jgi:hypothetical protein